MDPFAAHAGAARMLSLSRPARTTGLGLGGWSLSGRRVRCRSENRSCPRPRAAACRLPPTASAPASSRTILPHAQTRHLHYRRERGDRPWPDYAACGIRRTPIVTLDLAPLDPELRPLVQREFIGSILDAGLLSGSSPSSRSTSSSIWPPCSPRARSSRRSARTTSTCRAPSCCSSSRRGSRVPRASRHVSLPLVHRGLRHARRDGQRNAGRVSEDEFNHPTTMYGANKLYCEMLGNYYARHYKQLAAEPLSGKVDFRCVRFPGLISAETMPSGGTSDYAPEMIHAAARGESYACFVRPDTQIPFMAMPDGVEALLRLARAPKAALSRTAYNVTAFNPSAAEIRTSCCASSPTRRLRSRWTPSARGSSIPGPRTSTTAPRAATGGSCRNMISNADFRTT